jgi:Fur family zinc uptake transcriptional regulator
MSLKGERAMEARLDRVSDACAGRGAQLTDLRRQVLRLILESDGPVTAYSLLDRLKETRSGTPSTIYRVLDFLGEQGLIHKIERLNAFVACTDTGHAHAVQLLVCRRCGAVAEIEDADMSRAIERAAERAGFHPNHAGIEIDGTCASCARR